MSTHRSRITNILFGAVFAFGASAATAQASSYTVLHNFTGAPNDGGDAYNNVTFDHAGNLYGTANYGGSANEGVIFEIAPDGTETLLHSFDGAKGYDPNGGVTIDPASGDIFGTTTFGGSNSCPNGCGVLYQLTTGGTFAVVHNLDAGTDGGYPVGRLVRDKRGNLYGITTIFGPNGGGTVFAYSAKGAFTVLHAFGGSDGFSPQGNLMQDGAGNLYGATNAGGANNYGTIFKLTPKGNLTTLYSFTGGADGNFPVGGLARDKEGNLYGATNPTGHGPVPYGTVFKLSPAGTLTTLYTFGGSADGRYPEGNLLESGGRLYGTTSNGGAKNDGVVYEVDVADGSETVLYSFDGTDGANPQAGLTKRNGAFYGTASRGGVDSLGVVFRLKSN